MDEVLKHYQVLGLKEGCSEAELEEAYQERAQAWNPDNFSGNEKLRLNAQEKLRHINAAYEFLRVKRANATLAAQPGTSRPATFWAMVAVLALLLLGAALLLVLRTDW
jgi:curved DNA-binding protein CbpA